MTTGGSGLLNYEAAKAMADGTSDGALQTEEDNAAPFPFPFTPPKHTSTLAHLNPQQWPLCHAGFLMASPSPFCWLLVFTPRR